MAVTLEIRVGDLGTELGADALIFLRPLQPAGAIAAGALETFLNDLDHLLVLIEPYCHKITPF